MYVSVEGRDCRERRAPELPPIISWFIISFFSKRLAHPSHFFAMPKPRRPDASPVRRTSKKQKTSNTRYSKTYSRSSGKLNTQELKAFDTALSFNVDATAEVPATGQVSLILTGDTLANRDGATVTVKSFQMRGFANFVPAAGATAATHVIIYVVMDRQASGIAAGATDVLTSTNAATALPNVPNQFRFKILYRLVIPLVAQAGVTGAYNNTVVPFDIYYKFKEPPTIRYQSSGGTVADVVTNNIFLLAGSDGSSDDTVGINGNMRLRFTG